MAPHAALPPGTPETLQVTAVFDVFATVAEKEIVFPSSTLALGGEMLTVMDGGPGGCPASGAEAAPAHPARKAHTNASVAQPGRWALARVALQRSASESTTCEEQSACQHLAKSGSPRRREQQLARPPA